MVTLNDWLIDISNTCPPPTLFKFKFFNWKNLTFKKEISHINYESIPYWAEVCNLREHLWIFDIILEF